VKKLIIAAVCIAALSLPVGAALADTPLNNPANDWYINTQGAHKDIQDAKAEGGKAVEIATSGTGGPWEVATIHGLDGAIQTGDRVTASVWLRAASPGSIVFKVETRAEPWTALVEKQVQVNPDWQLQTVEFTATKDYPAASTQVALLLNTAKNTIYVGRLTVSKK
jgi:hypothetical protein